MIVSLGDEPYVPFSMLVKQLLSYWELQISVPDYSIFALLSIFLPVCMFR